jgi:hypothetical protein
MKSLLILLKGLGRPVNNLKIQIEKAEPFYDKGKKIAEQLFNQPYIVTSKGYLIKSEKPKKRLETITAELDLEESNSLNALLDFNRYFKSIPQLLNYGEKTSFVFSLPIDITNKCIWFLSIEKRKGLLRYSLNIQNPNKSSYPHEPCSDCTGDW